MQKSHFYAVEPFGKLLVQIVHAHKRAFVVALYFGTDAKRLIADFYRIADKAEHSVVLIAPYHESGYGQTIFRFIRNFGYVQIAVTNKRKSTRNRRRAHYQHVGDKPLCHKRAALLNAETMLFVAHAKRKIIKFHVALNNRVSADDYPYFAVFYSSFYFGFILTLGRAA